MFLNCHTYYSLRYGTLKIRDLLSLGQQNRAIFMALTDINSTSACLEFIRIASEYNVKPVIGVDFRNDAKQHFIMLAENNEGFQNINEYLSAFLHQRQGTKNAEIPSKAKQLPSTFVIYPFASFEGETLAENEFIGVRMDDINRLKFSPWKDKQSKLVILQTVTFQNKKGFNTHRLLRAIDNNTLLSKLPTSEQASENDVFISEEKLKKAFEEFPQLIKNTENLLNRCYISFNFSKETTCNQKSYTTSEDLDFRLLKKLAYAGIHYRYKRPGERVMLRMEKELGIIKEKGFVSYFLINWKILKYARSKGYFYVGRGSGANSIIAYLLRITDVDPVELDLYFERFINLYRKNPPDFDIDFSWQDRNDITDFIFNTFKNTALIAVYNTFKFKASVRELGKVFGLPKEEIDRLSTQDCNFKTLDKLSQLVIVYSQYIQGFPNYLGIHAGGILISEKPIHYYTATFMPPKGYATTQFDMVIAEDIGLYKFDILSQRGLGKIKDAVEIVKQNHPEKKPIDIHDIKRFKEDERIKDLLRNAKAIGCFYVESPAMRMLLRKLQVDDYLGLVAASSVIRPGVAKSGMMREYILRYRFPEKRKEAHPVLLEIMPETYGVMVYQEDVIKVAHHFGGLDLGEADMLRRGMSGKFRSREEFQKVKDQFFNNCKNSGKAEAFTTEVWRQIESFAGYAFAKGHSASYAVESYQSLFLKAYFPLEYMVATLNNGGGFYSVELYVHEARMHGANILQPCVNKGYGATIIDGKDIYIGFDFLQSLESKLIDRIITERNKNGAFESLDNFLERVSIGMEQVTILIKINAFRFTGRNKRELLWEAYMKINKVSFEENVYTLFKQKKIDYKTPSLPHTALEGAFDEMELLGFPLCSPFELLSVASENKVRATHLPNFTGKTVTIEGYLVTTKRTKTTNGQQMYFGTFVDRNGDFVDTVHFPPVANQYRFRGKGIYSITGKVIEEFDCINIEVIKMERLAIIQDPRYSSATVLKNSDGKDKTVTDNRRKTVKHMP
ncbi:DNA polymerase III subunit alpha [Aequorivita lipolytica]|uniref:DNA-directed DNA polymerase n=1 Tax=Aequorivita lipolytica TaxID=153267 RepID=A0A5C6YQQ6_9FLAO|nr:DNA polymerase III subunit alpha [Aequorivita lipolytica]TXD69708.1 DNA polymerase III subunit alpha [Aequorivita lipolytica]SRX51137.1 DNA polymerase III subunit alpha [Aequorivita lipolytica]